MTTRVYTWDNVLSHVHRSMAAVGLDAVSHWNGVQGTIRADIPHTESWAFVVNVRVDGDGTAVIGIVRPDDREVRDGQPWDARKRRPVPERSFVQGPRHEAEKQRFVRALRAETWDYAKRATVADVEGLASALQDVISRDPDAAGEAIAKMLHASFEPFDLATFHEAVRQADLGEPTP